MNFENANLKNVDFTDSDLRYANFTNANLTGSFLNFAKLKGANLTNAILDSVKVDRADWLIQLKKLNVVGADNIYENYKVDSVHYYSFSKTKKPMLLKR